MKQIKINIDTAQLVQNKLNVTSFTERFLYPNVKLASDESVFKYM